MKVHIPLITIETNIPLKIRDKQYKLKKINPETQHFQKIQRCLTPGTDIYTGNTLKVTLNHKMKHIFSNYEIFWESNIKV